MLIRGSFRTVGSPQDGAPVSGRVCPQARTDKWTLPLRLGNFAALPLLLFPLHVSMVFDYVTGGCNPFSSQVARSSILRCSGAIGQNQVPLRKDRVDAAEFYHSGGR